MPKQKYDVLMDNPTKQNTGWGYLAYFLIMCIIYFMKILLEGTQLTLATVTVTNINARWESVPYSVACFALRNLRHCLSWIWKHSWILQQYT